MCHTVQHGMCSVLRITWTLYVQVCQKDVKHEYTAILNHLRVKHNMTLTLYTHTYIKPELAGGCSPPSPHAQPNSISCGISLSIDLFVAIICRLNMEFDLQSLFGLHVNSRTNWLSLRPPPPHPLPTFGLIYRALLVSQGRRRLFVTPWLSFINFFRLALLFARMVFCFVLFPCH